MRKPLPSILFLSLACAITVAHADAEFSGAPEFSCLFTDLRACGFAEQSRGAGRVSLVRIAGMDSVRLHTRPGDSHVHGSRTAERSDLQLSQQASDCFEGREHWWAHSILFPDDYVAPPPPTASNWTWGVVFDFHDTASDCLPGAQCQANFHVLAMHDGLSFKGYGGQRHSPVVYEAPIGPVVRNVWHHFVYHVKWSSGTDGFFDAWVNGARKLTYRGPTLYRGLGCYLKLANYHSAFGRPSSVIHARVVRGATPGAVSAGPLEGIRHLRQASRNGR